MAQEHHDEVDLVYVIKKIKQIIKGWIVLLFKAIDFAVKFWIVILVLAVIGFGYGLYKIKDQKPKRKSNVVAKVNYELQPYIMNAVELYNSKAKTNDSVFLIKHGIQWYKPQVREVMVNPIVDFKDILEEYQINERSLDMLLNRMEFDEEMPMNEVLNLQYDYYEFDFSLSDEADEDDVQKFFDYINNDKKLLAYKAEARKNLAAQIEQNDKSLNLINDVFEGYTSTSGAPGVGVVGKGYDLSQLLESKLIIQDRNELLKNEYVLSSDILVPVHEIQTREGQGRLLHQKQIIYPLALVFLFFLLAYLRYIFLYLRRVARENE